MAKIANLLNIDQNDQKLNGKKDENGQNVQEYQRKSKKNILTQIYKKKFA